MASTSSKVHVDVDLFEENDRLNQVPRPSSHKPVRIELMVPGNVRFATGNIPVLIRERRKTIPRSNDGNGRPEVKQDGPFAKCGNQLSLKNGRFKCKLKVGKLMKLHMGLNLRINATLSQAVTRGVDLLSNGHSLRCWRQASDTALLGRTVSGVNAGKSTPQQINGDTHGAEGGTDIGGHCQTKTSLSVWDVESTSSYPEQVPAAGTHPNTSGLSSKIHPKCIAPPLFFFQFTCR